MSEMVSCADICRRRIITMTRSLCQRWRAASVTKTAQRCWRSRRMRASCSRAALTSLDFELKHHHASTTSNRFEQEGRHFALRQMVQLSAPRMSIAVHVSVPTRGPHSPPSHVEQNPDRSLALTLH